MVTLYMLQCMFPESGRERPQLPLMMLHTPCSAVQHHETNTYFSHCDARWAGVINV